MVGFLLAGLIVGALARLLRPGPHHISLGAALVLGLVGSLLGGLIANAVGTGGLFEMHMLGFLVAIGSVLLLLEAFDRPPQRRRIR